MPGIGVKLNLVAIVIAAFPVQFGPPARRHIMLCDAHGVTGLTVWHGDVHKFPREVLGGVVTVLRASVSVYQGKKSLVLNKDSSIEVDTVTTQSSAAMWWKSLADSRPQPLSDAVTASDNSIISVFGILAFISNETKEVNGHLRRITTRSMDISDASLRCTWPARPPSSSFGAGTLKRPACLTSSE
jgi:hypothetical protein